MKAKALIKFTDIKANKVRIKDSTFEVTKERFEQLNSTSWGAVVEEVQSKGAVKNEQSN